MVNQYFNTEEIVCKECSKKFRRRTKNMNHRPKTGNGTKNIREKNTVTCSRKCSFNYHKSKPK